MFSMIDLFKIESVLDIGSGTGRVILKAKEARPKLMIVGIEPSPELREVGYSKGVLLDELVDGDAQRLHFADGSFDLVCAFAALHHIPNPRKAVSEMLRVARKAIFLSDSNNFGQGTPVVRAIKQAINSLGLWRVADLIKTRGKGYSISAGDGLAYSYSVFSDYSEIARRCKSVHVVNTVPAGRNLYRSAAHVALLGLKNEGTGSGSHA